MLQPCSVCRNQSSVKKQWKPTKNQVRSSTIFLTLNCIHDKSSHGELRPKIRLMSISPTVVIVCSHPRGSTTNWSPNSKRLVLKDRPGIDEQIRFDAPEASKNKWRNNLQECLLNFVCPFGYESRSFPGHFHPSRRVNRMIRYVIDSVV